MMNDSHHGSPDDPPAVIPAVISKSGAVKRSGLGLLAGLGILAFVLLALVFSFAGSQRLPMLTPETLDAAIARWENNGPTGYDADIVIQGNRPGVVHVEVRQGVVTRMIRDGKAPSQERTWSVWSVPGQFDMIERELELADDPEGEMQASRGTKLWLRCEFDPDYGYPKKFHRAVSGGGPEVYWQVESFLPKGRGE